VTRMRARCDWSVPMQAGAVSERAGSLEGARSGNLSTRWIARLQERDQHTRALPRR
jgi:hypothetical protein